MLCLARDDTNERTAVTWLDAGIGSVAVAPTITSVTSADAYSVDATVAANGAGDPMEVYVAVTDTSVGTHPTDNAAEWLFATQTGAGTVHIGNLPPAKRIWVRARSYGNAPNTKLPSVWVYSAHLDLASGTAVDLSPPSATWNPIANSPPTASLDFVSEDDTQVTLALNGAIGVGDAGPLQYSWRVGTGAWSAFSTTHANQSIPRAPKLPKIVQLQTKQGDGQVSQTAPYTVTGSYFAVNIGTGQIDNAAPIGTRTARDVAHQVGRYFTETWEDPVATHWSLVNGTANTTTVGVNGVGGSAAAFTGGQQWRYAGRLPFNATKLYRFRAIVAMANGGTPIGTTYLGVECFDGTGASLGVAWVATNNLLLPDFAQHTYTGWFKDTVGYTGLEAHDPSAPGGLIATTAYIAPRFAFNQGNTDGLSQVYCYAIQIDELDEDAAQRIYGGMDAGSNLLGTVQQYDNPAAPTLNKKPIKGYQSGVCCNGQAITFPAAFQNPPAMRFSRGNNTITNQPDSTKWSTPGSFVAGKAQIEDVRPAALSATGFTCVAQLVQTGSGTSQNSEFPTSNSLTVAGQTTQLALANVPSSNGHYTVRYTVSLTVTSILPHVRTANVVVVVNRRAGGPTGAITELRRDTYSCTDSTGSGTTYLSGVLVYDINGTLASGDYLEVKIDSITSLGAGSTVTAVHGCNQTDDPGYDGESHTYGAATITSSMTQDVTHDNVVWEAWSWQ